MLRSAQAPEWSENYWEAFPHHIQRRLEAGTPLEPKPRVSRLTLGWTGALAAAAGLVVGFLLWHRSPVPPGSLPVRLVIEQGGQRRELVTYSGQSLRVGDTVVEVLANPDGQIILIGSDFLWSSGHADTQPRGLRLQAALLNRKF